MKRFVVIETLRNGPAVLDRETGLRECISKNLVNLLDRDKVDFRKPDLIKYRDIIPLSKSIRRGSEVMATYFSFKKNSWRTRKHGL